MYYGDIKSMDVDVDSVETRAKYLHESVPGAPWHRPYYLDVSVSWDS